MEKILDRKIKLIWDFRGPAASETAKHYEEHLQDYLELEELKFNETGIVHHSGMHSSAYLVVAEFEMRRVRDDLKPHRGEFHED